MSRSDVFMSQAVTYVPPSERTTSPYRRKSSRRRSPCGTSGTARTAFPPPSGSPATVLGGHGPREPEAIAESRSGFRVGLQPGPAAGGSEPGGVHADEHPRREVTVEADGDLLAVPPLEQLLEHGSYCDVVVMWTV